MRRSDAVASVRCTSRAGAGPDRKRSAWCPASSAQSVKRHDYDRSLEGNFLPSIYHLYGWQRDGGDMPTSVSELRHRSADSEKITINLGFVDLGQIDLMVKD